MTVDKVTAGKALKATLAGIPGLPKKKWAQALKLTAD
jgi:hypothetical protein